MKKLQAASDNELSELTDLLGRISDLIKHDFTHVAHLLPKSITKDVDGMLDRVFHEVDTRQDR